MSNFPIKVGNTSGIDTYIATLTNGEEQLLITRDGKQYLSKGDGTKIQVSDVIVVDTLPSTNIQPFKIYILPDFSMNYYDSSWHKLNEKQIVIGTTNTDTTKLWLDTTSTPILKYHNGNSWVNISSSNNINKSITISISDWILDANTNTYKATVIHGLNTEDIIPYIYDSSKQAELVGITIIDSNTVELENKIAIDGKLIINYCGSISNTTSKWSGKKFVTFGDSITWYDGKTYDSGHIESGIVVKGYQSFMREKLACNVINAGTDGYTMPLINNVIKSYDFSSVNAVTITSGANDFRNNVSIGTLQAVGGTFNNTTYVGAMQESIEHILNFNPEIKIYLITPIKGWNESSSILPTTYIDAINNVAKLYSLSVCDWYNNSGINNITKSIYIGDVSASLYKLHPTLKGYERMANILIPFLENN